jgi:predicted RNase H-like HicB family nuclease
MRCAVVIEKGPTSYGATVPDLPGCAAVGRTEQEVRRLIRQAIDARLRADVSRLIVAASAR